MVTASFCARLAVGLSASSYVPKRVVIKVCRLLDAVASTYIYNRDGILGAGITTPIRLDAAVFICTTGPASVGPTRGRRVVAV